MTLIWLHLYIYTYLCNHDIAVKHTKLTQIRGKHPNPISVCIHSLPTNHKSFSVKTNAFRAFRSSSFINSNSLTLEYFLGSLRIKNMMSSTEIFPRRPTSIAFFVWNSQDIKTVHYWSAGTGGKV